LRREAGAWKDARMDWTPIVVGAVVVIAVVALVLFRKKAKLEVQLPLGVKATFEGSNEGPAGTLVGGVKHMRAKRDIKVRDKGAGEIASFDAGQDIEIDRTGGGDRPKKG
jgi:hypothetical protein